MALSRENSGLVVAPSADGAFLELFVDGKRVPGAMVELMCVDGGGQEVRVYINAELVKFGDAPKGKTAELRAIGSTKPAVIAAAGMGGGLGAP
jgi:hypothetical protein